ncbi:hypothetical protein [Clostridium manihotivorum]|uniref:hypothetical protein n=1 Tax=Clostridium manihotivorum TaxID=2320868 RepID=UPI001EE5BF94|nr:hypothetical protein [Clostridium manihotivorum]
MLQPKLVKAQFDCNFSAAAFTVFSGKKIHVKYENQDGLEYGDYRIAAATLDGSSLELKLVNGALIVEKKVIDELSIDEEHELVVQLVGVNG